MAPISFDLIPATLRTPAVVLEYSSERAQSGLSIQPFKVLLLGQRISSQVRATGTLVLAGQPADGDQFLIGDGLVSVTFQFETAPVLVPTDTLRPVPIGALVGDTLTNLQTAVNGAPTFNVTAGTITGGDTLNLQHDLAGTVGNVAITEPVNVSTNLSDTGMAGGDYSPTGSGTSLVPYRIGSPQEAANLWGSGSMLHREAIAFFKNNAFTEVWGIAFDDTLGGVAATATVTVSGAAGAAGDLVLYVGGIRFEVPVAAGANATTIAASIATAINADILAPVTAAPALGVVTITAKNAGTVASALDLRHSHNPGEVLPAGISLVTTAFTGGAGGVNLATVFAAIGEEWFHLIVSPYNGSNLPILAAELESRWGPLRAIESFGVTATTGDLAAVAVVAGLVNSGHMAVIPSQGSPTWTPEIAAAAAGVIAFYASIDPARPFNGLPLIGVVAPRVENRWTLSQRNTLLYAGVTTTRVDDAGAVVLERVISTYRTNSVGAADTAFLDATTHFTLAFLRYDLVTTLKTKYPRAKLASDETRLAAGQAIVTPGIMRGELIARAGLWESLGLVEDLESFKLDLIVERDPTDRTRLNFKLPPNLVNPLIVLAGRITFIL